MNYEMIEYKSIIYKCRTLIDSFDDTLLIGNLDLLNALQPNGNDGDVERFDSYEAEAIYDEVFYFTELADKQLEDEELKIALVEESPELNDWFDLPGM